MVRNRLLTFGIGIYFGVVLVKSQVVSWQRIHEMFLFQDAYMYLVITSAIAVGALSLFIIRRARTKALGGEAIVIERKPFHKGVIFGGTFFGMGWAVTGACPGPIYGQIGAGTLMAIFTFLGALAGMYLYAFLQPRLPHSGWQFLGAGRGSAGAPT